MMSGLLPNPLREAVERIGAVRRVEAVSAGQSGADVWRVDALAGGFAVRRWPPGVTLERVRQIEHFLRHLRSRGIDAVPAPWDLDGAMPLADAHGRVWSIETWINGSSVAEDSIDAVRLHAVVQLLTAIHHQSRELGVHCQVPLAVRRRAGRLAELPQALSALVRRAGRIEPFASAVDELRNYADRRLPPLRAAYGELVTQPQPCWMVIRDLHRQHVLYQGQRLAGIVDFDAVRVDTPLADLARLLGSLLLDDLAMYREAVRWYFAPARPEAAQLRLVDLLDEATALCAAVYWLERLSERDDASGWQLLSWHRRRLRHFPFGWSRSAAADLLD